MRLGRLEAIASSARRPMPALERQARGRGRRVELGTTRPPRREAVSLGRTSTTSGDERIWPAAIEARSLPPRSSRNARRVVAGELLTTVVSVVQCVSPRAMEFDRHRRGVRARRPARASPRGRRRRPRRPRSARRGRREVDHDFRVAPAAGLAVAVAVRRPGDRGRERLARRRSAGLQLGVRETSAWATESTFVIRACRPRHGERARARGRRR